MGGKRTNEKRKAGDRSRIVEFDLPSWGVSIGSKVWDTVRLTAVVKIWLMATAKGRERVRAKVRGKIRFKGLGIGCRGSADRENGNFV